MQYLILIHIILLLLLSSCSPSKYSKIYERFNKATQVNKVINSLHIANCGPGPGAIIYSGVDKNFNGKLDGSEIKKLRYICDDSSQDVNQSGFELLFEIYHNNYIAYCENSGMLLLKGLDLNRSEDLQLAELEEVLYLCDSCCEDRDTLGLNIVEIIDPCGEGGNDEVLLKLSNGDFISYFNNFYQWFAVLLGDVVYETTDTQQCKFRIKGGNYYEL